MIATQPRGKVNRTSITKRILCEAFPNEEMPPKNRSSLARVLRYENESVVTRIMEDEGLNHDEAYERFKKALRFLWGTQNGGARVPTESEDQGWHAFLLFTRDYMKFCHKYFGRFIHHQPTPLAELRRLGVKGASQVDAMHCTNGGDGPANCRDQSCHSVN